MPQHCVPQGGAHDTSFCHAVLTQLLENLDCEVWVNYVLFWGGDPTEPFDTLHAKLEDVGLFDSGMAVEGMSHERLGFLTGGFSASQLRWPTLDKEAFAFGSTFRRLGYLL